ncbi:MAG: galactose-1-phosphate uridylyltransferase [Candidatus Omnitrophica bacterium]|nr:galactose-1-phosphate uridylyltransferase [Candidatus Omnitrophota bacterium]
MDQLRRDPIVGRWVIAFTDNPRKPEQFKIDSKEEKKRSCPFCYSQAKWSTRVVPNKYPALTVEGELDRQGLGMYDQLRGVGSHEIIIETPDHRLSLADLPVHHLEKVIWAYRDRSADLGADQRFRYIMVFKNQGFSAGASLSHSHTQLIALPMIPKNVKEELRGARAYFEFKERCIFCDMITQERDEQKRMVGENSRFIAFAPFCSRFPFEVWILPKEHHSDFCDVKTEDVIELAKMLKEVLQRIKSVFRDPPYNFIIHTGPIQEANREDYHWHIEIMPKLLPVAGFEWGSGFYINPTPPENAAKYLREVKIAGLN